jgi:ADP-ribose pyrophosphatase YjhB (NUDIX family)
VTEHADQPAPELPPRLQVTARGLIVDSDDCWLLVRRVNDEWWQLPGGKAKPGELPSEACKREVAKVTGLELVPGGLRVLQCARTDAPEPVLRCSFIFDMSVFRAAGAVRQIRVPADEIAEWRWVRQDEALETLLRPDYRTRLIASWSVPATSIYMERGLYSIQEGSS